NDFGGACSFCSFQGVNPSAPSLFFQLPIGRSVYNALQLKLVQDIKKPLSLIRALNFQLAYSLSRFENPGTLDQDFGNSGALDNNRPNRHNCRRDRKSTRLNSSHVAISYAVFCLKKKKSQ